MVDQVKRHSGLDSTASQNLENFFIKVTYFQLWDRRGSLYTVVQFIIHYTEHWAEEARAPQCYPVATQGCQC